MELKIKLYEDRLCRKLKEEKTASDFGLSVGLCEEILNAVNIDMFLDGGFSALSDESKLELILPIIKENYSFFKELLAELFEVSVEDISTVDIMQIGVVIMNIIAYAVNKMKPFAKKDKSGKN